MSTPITPTKAQIQLFNDLRNIIHYPPTHEALEKGVALIAESEARAVAQQTDGLCMRHADERDQLRAEVERLTGVKETLKHNWSVTNTRAEKAEAEGAVHVALLSRIYHNLASGWLPRELHDELWKAVYTSHIKKGEKTTS